MGTEAVPAIPALVERLGDPDRFVRWAALRTLGRLAPRSPELVVPATARLLFVHPNTVRYRLRRVAELTEYTPSAGRDGFTLWVAITLGRLTAKRS